MRPLRAVLLTVLLPMSVAALDIGAGDTAWLDQKFRPEWTMETLQEALDQIGRQAERGVKRSEGVAEVEKDLHVTIVARERVTLREILGWLETTTKIRFRAEPLALKVETGKEERNRRRRYVDLNLTEYGSGIWTHDMPGPWLGYRAAHGGGAGGGFNILGGETVEESNGSVAPEDVIDLLREGFSDDGASGQHRGLRAWLWVTPEEEKAIRVRLDQEFRRATARSAWVVSFGTVAGGDLPLGLVDGPQAEALVARMAERRQITLAGLLGQMVSAGSLGQRAVLDDLEVVNERLDPVIEVLNTGRGVELRALRGLENRYLAFRVSWVDPIALGQQPIAHLPTTPAAEATATAVLPKDGADGEVTANFTAARRAAGERVVLDKPEVWTWEPNGEVVLAPGRAVVLAAPRGDRQAVIVIKEAP